MTTHLEVGAAWLAELAGSLPGHGRLIAELASAVGADDRLRWFQVGCSLGAGRGDQLSDVDCAIGYLVPLAEPDLDELGRSLVTSVGVATDVLVHTMEGFPPGTRRFGVEYDDDVQLDLVMLSSTLTEGLRDGEIAIVDKDGALAHPAASRLYGPPDERVSREWALMGWWFVSDLAKYLRRGSLFEAADRIERIRGLALNLFAAAQGVPYPLFGLTSLLDYEPFRLPDGLANAYAHPGDRASVEAAGAVVVALLGECSGQAAAQLGHDLSTPWEDSTRARLAAAFQHAGLRPDGATLSA